MKRLLALALTLCLALPALAVGEQTDGDKTVDKSAYGVMVIRNHEVRKSAKQEIDMEYPTFECDDAELQRFLTDSITTPILALRKLGQMTKDEAYANGETDKISGAYYASMDFENLLSVEATIGNREAGSNKSDTSLFYRIVDLTSRRVLTVYELFEQKTAEVDEAIRNIVFGKASAQGMLMSSITDASLIPKPSSYYVCADYIRTIYASGAINNQALMFNIPWDTLPLTPSSLLKPASAPALSASTGAQSEAFNGNVNEGEDSDLDGDFADDTDGDTSDDAIDDTAPENGDTADGITADGNTADGGDANASAPTDTPTPAVTQAAQNAIDPNFSLPPVNTPTPMPVTGDDAITVDVLTRGLWKKLGTDGEVYYQFTRDGKLLTVTVSDYTVAEGELQSDVLNGAVDVGSDSAFTLRDASGAPSGYVLNRAGEFIAPEELVTPSPTPVPTPSPTPTPVPTPSPTPVPTPTLSPFELALQQTPSLAPLGDAHFEKERTLKVYSAPEKAAYRDSGAQVTTNEQVLIYGTVGDWVLVSYHIGNGSRGRVGYIENTTLMDAQGVAKLGLASIPYTLTKNVSLTDDPLNSKAPIMKLKKGEIVTLLAFMGDEWAYVETTYKSKVCRLFMPKTALMED